MITSGPLGPDYKAKLEWLIEEWLTDLCAEGANKKTGEISQEDMALYHQIENELRKEARQRLKRYQSHSIATRIDLKLTPFDWRNETPDRVRQALSHAYSNLPKLRDLTKKPDDSTERSTEINPNQGWSLDDRDPTSCVGEAYAHYQQTGEYPETIKEPLNAIFADLEERHRNGQ